MVYLVLFFFQFVLMVERFDGYSFFPRDHIYNNINNNISAVVTVGMASRYLFVV